MKPHLGDDMETGQLRLGEHAHGDDVGGSDVFGGHSVAVRASGSVPSAGRPVARQSPVAPPSWRKDIRNSEQR